MPYRFSPALGSPAVGVWIDGAGSPTAGVEPPGTGNETSTTKAPLLPTETQMKYPSTSIGGTAGSTARSAKWAVTSGNASSRLFGSETVITSRFAPTRMTVVLSVGSTVVEPSAGELLGAAVGPGVAAGVGTGVELTAGPPP